MSKKQGLVVPQHFPTARRLDSQSIWLVLDCAADVAKVAVPERPDPLHVLAIPIATITADTQNRAPLLVTIVYCLYIANEMAWNRKKVLITWRRETLLSSKE
jgi:hypothetical protein